MESKKIRDLIATLIILIIGIKLLMVIGFSYIFNAGFELPEFTALIEPLGNMMIFGLLFLAIILLPFYLSKRSEEKKLRIRVKENIEKR